ncbi:MAG TPA: aminotransferase class V-fold PLP-dependent enzyme [Thermoanaerobaculia bacterium]|nr:aminotransferase class V-fold PLP-dependent enzyme [Thermoanaerobaculia bacterium]
MGIGGDLIGDLEQLLVARTLQRKGPKALFRMTGATSQCWRAEMEVQSMYQGMRCLLLPSATIASSLLLELLGLEPGREILVTPFGWVSNWSCIRRARLVPRFLPLDDRLQLKAADVAERITERTGAVIVTHLLGRGQQEIEEISRVCTARGIPLFEDIAQSFGVSVGRRRAGSFGTAAWCSMNHNKILSTGDGGFALVRDEALFGRLSAWHDHGNIMENGKRRPATVLEPGLSLRTSEVVAAVLRAQLARYPLVRARILSFHEAVARACEGLGLELIEACEGDVPFTVLFRRTPEMRYPSLLDGGWHVASNVPWLADELANASKSDAALETTIERLRSTAAVGTGFVDSYHGIDIGLRITDSIAGVPRLVEELEKRI